MQSNISIKLNLLQYELVIAHYEQDILQSLIMEIFFFYLFRLHQATSGSDPKSLMKYFL